MSFCVLICGGIIGISSSDAATFGLGAMQGSKSTHVLE